MRLFQGRTIQRYILKEFIVAFCLTLMAVTLLMLLATLYQLSSDYGITVGKVALLSPFLLPKPISYAIPLATMIAATMVFSRMSAEDEVLAAQAGGAPLRVLVAPIFVASGLLSLFCLWNNQWGMAWSNSVIRNQILRLDDPESFYKVLNQPGTSRTMPTDNGSVACINLLPLATDPETKEVRRPIHIAIFQNEQVALTVLADDFTYKVLGKPGERVLSLTLKRAKKLGESPAFFDEVTMEIPQPPLETLFSYGTSNGQRGWLDNYRDSQIMHNTFGPRHRFLLERGADFAASVVAGNPTDPPAPIMIGNAWSSARNSTEAIYATGGAVDQVHADIVECVRKIALSILPMSMGLLGIGLGLLVKKSQRMVGFLTSLLVYALVYYPLMLVGKELAMAGKIGMAALWIPNALLFAAGVALCVVYERGFWTGAPPIFTEVWKDLVHIAEIVARPFSSLRAVGGWFFRKKTDGYIAGAFIVPLVVVLLTVAAIFTAMDLVEHGSEVVQGIIKAGEPSVGVVARPIPEAIQDVCVFYGICSLYWICDLIPAIILIAGLLCIYSLIRNSEHLIYKSAGMPLQRAFRPIIIITLLLSAAVTQVRETAMPPLLLWRDYLRPMVYHRGRTPHAVALYTVDTQGHPVIFEMSEYSSATKVGKDLRIFFVDFSGMRISSIVADIATWDGSVWKLQTDPNKLPNGKPGKSKVTATLPLKEHGYYIQPDPESGSIKDEGAVVQIRNTKRTIDHWSGIVTPALLASDQLGAGVMRLGELSTVGEIKSGYLVEWWRRISEPVMGVLLLWTAIPLLLIEESPGPLAGVGWSILIGAGYWALNMTFVQAATDFLLPVWSPVIPHVFFLLVGRQQYYVRMQT